MQEGTGQITSNKIDKQHIYEVTQRINNNLHFNFGMTDLQDRRHTNLVIQFRKTNIRTSISKNKFFYINLFLFRI